MTSRTDDGRITRITGSLIMARGVAGTRMHDLVKIGDRQLLGEVIAFDGDTVSVQVYEDTTGVRVDEPVTATGGPLVAELGPGLLGSIFDGIQRPLPTLHEQVGPFLGATVSMPSIDRTRHWDFEPVVTAGDTVEPGLTLGFVEEGSLRHPILVPPGVQGEVASVEPGDHTIDEAVVHLENGASLSMLQRWPVRRARPHKGKRPLEALLVTGQRVFDTFFPVAQGGAVVVPGGFGTGKTVVEHLLARYSNVDVIVYIGCGERGNEMTALLTEFPQLSDPGTGRPLMERTLLIANTSNMPVAAREASLYIGMTIAEYYRDMGHRVAVMADSTSRWAEALREVSSRLGEMPGEEGYPPYLAARLASYYERAGVVRCLGPEERNGSVTVVSAVSPPGGDFSEPVTQASLRVAGALWALDVDLAQRRHFPAVSCTDSYSLYVGDLEAWFAREIGPDWSELRLAAMRLLQEEEEVNKVVQVVGADALPDRERLTLRAARLLREGFLQQHGFHPVDAFCPVDRQLATLRLFLTFIDRCREALSAGEPLDELLENALWDVLQRVREVPHDGWTRQIDELHNQVHAAF